MALTKTRMTVCWEGTAFKYWRECLKRCWIFRVPLLSCRLGWCEVQPHLPGRVPVLISVSRCRRWWLFFFSGGHVGGNRICAEASHGERGPRSFDENSRTAVKEEKIKSAAPSALVSADPSWESLRDHNTSHKTAGAWPAVWKGPASHWSERAPNWRRDRVKERGGGREKGLSYTQVEWGS